MKIPLVLDLAQLGLEILQSLVGQSTLVTMGCHSGSDTPVSIPVGPALPATGPSVPVMTGPVDVAPVPSPPSGALPVAALVAAAVRRPSVAPPVATARTLALPVPPAVPGRR